MTTLLLIRHGENEYTRTGKLAGWTPGVSLNEAGQKQAQALVERLKGAPIKHLYSSPLERARETAAPLAAALGLPVEIRPALGEVRYGGWTGKSLKRLARTKLWRVVQGLPSAMQFPEGETMRGAQLRMRRLVRRYTGEVSGVVDAAAAVVPRDLGVRAQRSSAHSVAVDDL